MESGVQCVMTIFFRQKQILLVETLGLLATSAMELLVLVFLGMCMHAYIFKYLLLYIYLSTQSAVEFLVLTILTCTLNVTYGNHNPLPATIPSLLGTVPHARSHTSVGSV